MPTSKDSTHTTRTGMTLLGKMRLRVFATVFAVILAVWGAIALSPGWALLPIVGVAFAAVTMTVNKLTHRLGHTTCWTCGQDISGEDDSPHGRVCPSCGSLNLNPDPVTSVADAADPHDRGGDQSRPA